MQCNRMRQFQDLPNKVLSLSALHGCVALCNEPLIAFFVPFPNKVANADHYRRAAGQIGYDSSRTTLPHVDSAAIRGSRVKIHLATFWSRALKKNGQNKLFG